MKCVTRWKKNMEKLSPSRSICHHFIVLFISFVVLRRIKMKFIKGFRIVDIPLQENGGVIHSLFVKEHADRQKKDSNGKILFVGNVDYRQNMSHNDIDEYLRLLFSRFGEVVSISVSAFSADDHANTRFAHLEFAKKSSMKLIMTTPDNELFEEIAHESVGLKVIFKWLK